MATRMFHHKLSKLLSLVCFGFTQITNGHDEPVHEVISAAALGFSSAGVTLENVFQCNPTVFLLKSSFDQELPSWMRVKGANAAVLIAAGARAEDRPFRFANHFCNPFDDTGPGLTDATEIWPFHLPEDRHNSWHWVSELSATGRQAAAPIFAWRQSLRQTLSKDY